MPGQPFATEFKVLNLKMKFKFEIIRYHIGIEFKRQKNEHKFMYFIVSRSHGVESGSASRLNNEYT